jgi:hypothetical protein
MTTLGSSPHRSPGGSVDGYRAIWASGRALGALSGRAAGLVEGLAGGRAHTSRSILVVSGAVFVLSARSARRRRSQAPAPAGFNGYEAV